MSLTPREIGTLIVVVLKANHLPNKRHIGKQDPYCVVSVNGEKRRTKAIKRGGQHPEWDEEIRFTLYEDISDLLERTARGDGTPPLPPPKDDKALKKIKGGKIMKLACFADDPREPDLIGEADVDLTEVLTRGETDEWFTLMNKDKFSGKVYLELTFWSNEPAPEKKATPKPVKSKQYGGPGSFTPSGDLPSSSSNGVTQPSRIVSTGSIYDHSRQNSESIPASLRASTSLAQLDLYVPPYEHRSHLSPIDKVASEFGEFSISEPHRRRESFPPPRGGHTPRPSSPTGYSTFSSHPPHGYDHNTPDTLSLYSLNQLSGQSSLQPRPNTHYSVQPPYQPQYETGLPSTYHQPHIHRPRHSIPTSSSGFIPLPTPSGFGSHSSHLSDPNLFVPPMTPTPTPLGYGQSQFSSQQSYAPISSQAPASVNVEPYLAPSSNNFHSQLPFPPSQSFPYSQYASSPSVSASPQQYAPPPIHTPQPQPIQSAPQSYTGYAVTSTPSHDNIPASIPPPSAALSSFSSGSRPLPQQPQVVFAQPQIQVPYSTPPSGSPQQQHPNSYSPSQAGVTTFPTSNTYQAVPPPPLPPIQYNTDQPMHQSYPSDSRQALSGPPPPPPPPPPLSVQTNPASTSRRQSSLPQPPVNTTYQQPVYQQPPIPPPPPPAFYAHNQPPPPPPPIQITSQNTSYHTGPPHNPPIQQDSQGGHWITQASQSKYV